MILVNELKGRIVANGYTQAQVAEKIGITPKTFYIKLQNGVFGSDEIEKMISLLKLEDPMSIFFADESTLKDTESPDK